MIPKVAEAKLIKSLFVDSPREITICSPWISSEGVTLLSACLERIRAKPVEVLRVWCRVSVEDHLQGFTDYPALSRMLCSFEQQHRHARIDLATAENLHAKVYCVDRKYIIGSANLTKGGFGGGNIEIVACGGEPETYRVRRVLKELERHLKPMPLSQFNHFCQQVERMPPREFRTEYAKLLNRYKPARAPHYDMRFR